MPLAHLPLARVGAVRRTVCQAWRKKSLSCHPDKAGDDPKAAELFEKIGQIKDVLLDKMVRHTQLFGF